MNLYTGVFKIVQHYQNTIRPGPHHDSYRYKFLDKIHRIIDSVELLPQEEVGVDLHREKFF